MQPRSHLVIIVVIMIIIVVKKAKSKKDDHRGVGTFLDDQNDESDVCDSVMELMEVSLGSNEILFGSKGK